MQKIMQMELKIREHLKSKGMTQRALASSLGVSEQTIGNILSGRVAPSLDTLERIAEALNVEIWQLFRQQEQTGKEDNNISTCTCPHCGKKIYIKNTVSS